VGTLADPLQLHVSSSLDRNLCAPCTDALHFDGFMVRYHARWLPLDHNEFVPNQPRVSVRLSIPKAFNGPDPGYICFTHILQVKPVRRYEDKPPSPYPGITHVSPFLYKETPVSIFCTNLDDVLSCHKKYWQKQRAPR
jgi:hypothetical protein